MLMFDHIWPKIHTLPCIRVTNLQNANAINQLINLNENK